MIESLNIKNFALIDDVSLEYKNGFNVITGETGAGKTLLLSAIKFILGEKVNKTFIRKGSDFADIQVSFDISQNINLKEKLKNLNISHDPDENLVIRRILNSKGKNKIYVNEVIITIQKLKELLEDFVQISSQHQNQKLLDPEYQRKLLDNYAKVDKDLSRYTEVYSLIKSNALAYKKMNEDYSKDLDQKISFLKFQVKELKSLHLEKGDLENLKQDIKLLEEKKESKILEYKLNLMLEEGDNPIPSVVEDIIMTVKDLKKNSLPEDLYDAIFELKDSLENLDRSFFKYKKNNLGFDDEAYDDLLSKQEKIDKILIKYKCASEEKYFDKLKNLEEELDLLSNIEKEKEKLTKNIEKNKKEAFLIAKDISSKRKSAAKKLSKEIESLLKEFSMEDAEVKIIVEGLEKLGKSGTDKIHYQIAPNKGIGFSNIEKIASGGELSRISLALQILSATKNQVLIFDEIDTGIGGKVALNIGKYLRNLSNQNQILCVSHNPQVAIYGNYHFYIEKKKNGDLTDTIISTLNDKDRHEEIARMMTGEVSKKSIALAKELLLSKKLI